MLYVLTLSTYLISFATLPYLARTLGPETFGIIGIAMGSMLFVQLIIDFGFTLYATGKVSMYRKNDKEVSLIYMSVMVIKAVLSLVSLVTLLALSTFIPFLHDHLSLFIIYALASIAQSLLPDFLYRGYENMSPITIRAVIAKIIFAGALFLFLKEPSQYMLAPTFLLAGNLFALLIAFVDMEKRYNLSYTLPNFKYIKSVAKGSSVYFYSRIASTLYGASSTLLLGVFTNSASVGLFSSADKLVSAIKTFAAPVSDALYPHMIATKNFKLMKKVIVLSSFLSMSLAIILFLFSDEIIGLLFGSEYIGASSVLKALTPIVALSIPYYLIGFPTMTPLGIDKHANYSIFLAAITYVLIAGALITTGSVSTMSLAISMSVCEFISFLYRSLVIATHSRKMLYNKTR